MPSRAAAPLPDDLTPVVHGTRPCVEGGRGVEGGSGLADWAPVPSHPTGTPLTVLGLWGRRGAGEAAAILVPKSLVLWTEWVDRVVWETCVH